MSQTVHVDELPAQLLYGLPVQEATARSVTLQCSDAFDSTLSEDFIAAASPLRDGIACFCLHL